MDLIEEEIRDLLSGIVDAEVNQSVKFSNLEKKTLILKEESGDELYEVVDCQTGRTYTLKEFSSPFDANRRVEINLEFQSLKGLNHPNLVTCYQLLEMGDRIYLLLEHVNHVSFTSLDDLASVAYQVLLGLDYLHQRKICHGEVKPSNIFMNSEERVKVLYLGEFSSKSSESEMSGIRPIHDGVSWDLWNLGLSILQLRSDSRFKGSAVKECININESSSPSQATIEPSVELWRFLDSCMSTDLSQRWTAERLLSHPFFKRQRIRDWKKVIRDVEKTYDPAESSFLSLSTKRKKESYKILSSTGADTSASVASESTMSYLEEEQISPNTKKYKISMADKDSMNTVKTSKDSSEKGYFGHHDTTDYMLRCLRHCFLFLPDCEFEMDKLIHMWIAEECIEVEGTERAEDVASRCFNDLVNKEVIIPTRFNNPYRERMHKVNPSRVSTLFPEQHGYLRIDEGHLGEISGEALHLLWKCKSLDQSLSHSLKNCKQLRTLCVVEDRGFPNQQVPNGVFLGLKYLRTLDLSHGNIFELPGSVGTVESLRYLDVSYTPIKELPESTACLSRLETLNLRDCSRLHMLPREFRNLKKLRHLDLDIFHQLKSMPKGMGSLTKLQTLKAFLVDKNEGFRVGELENMNEITGAFSIIGLENVSSANEAKKAALGDKKRIDELVLRWNDHDHASDLSKDRVEILECLAPHFGLKELTIICFRGSKLPSWISNPSFTNLSGITLLGCTGCDLLPYLGGLPSLMYLHIDGMESVMIIGAMFCRSVNDQKTRAFPKLEKLKFEKMLNLKEWTGIEEGDFPCLRRICIRYCPKLTSLPSMSHLYSLQHLELCNCAELASLPEGLLPDSVKTLIINDCPKVSEQCLKDEGQDRFKISSVKEVWIDFDKLSLD